jgi:hypothetical protein
VAVRLEAALRQCLLLPLSLSRACNPVCRLFHYDDTVRRQFAITLKKELVGLRLVTAYEQQHLRPRSRMGNAASHRGFDWILLVREDAHWFSRLDLGGFAPGATHGKACAQCMCLPSDTRSRPVYEASGPCHMRVARCTVKRVSSSCRFALCVCV